MEPQIDNKQFIPNTVPAWAIRPDEDGLLDAIPIIGWVMWDREDFGPLGPDHIIRKTDFMPVYEVDSAEWDTPENDQINTRTGIQVTYDREDADNIHGEYVEMRAALWHRQQVEQSPQGGGQ